MGIWIFLHAISPLFTTLTLSTTYLSISYKEAFKIHALHLPAKYLPGGIWHSVARSKEYYDLGFSTKHVSLYLLHEHIIVAACTLFVGASIIIVMGENINYSIFISALSLLSLCVLTIWPFSIRLANNNLKFMCSIKRYFFSILIIIFYWLLAGYTFASFFENLPETNTQCSIFHSIGSYIFSWGIGFIAIFAPQGIGITEFVASEYLCNSYSTNNLIALIASFRVIILIADLLTWAITRTLISK